MKYWDHNICRRASKGLILLFSGPACDCSLSYCNKCASPSFIAFNHCIRGIHIPLNYPYYVNGQRQISSFVSLCCNFYVPSRYFGNNFNFPNYFHLVLYTHSEECCNYFNVLLTLCDVAWSNARSDSPADFLLHPVSAPQKGYLCLLAKVDLMSLWKSYHGHIHLFLLWIVQMHYQAATHLSSLYPNSPIYHSQPDCLLCDFPWVFVW